jgi:hypothetical protein
MGKNKTCQILCSADVPGEDAVFINDRIREKYLFNWMVDGLPAAQKSDTGMESTIPGFHLGQRIQSKTNGGVRVLLTGAIELIDILLLGNYIAQQSLRNLCALPH